MFQRAIIVLAGATTLFACGSAPAEAPTAQVAEASIDQLLYPGGTVLEDNYWRVESEIQVCMQAAGFEYIPRDLIFEDSPVVPRLHSLTEDTARDIGFGLASGFTIGPGPNDVDPNDVILSELAQSTPGEAETWLESLRGVNGNAGCRAKAWQTINGEWESTIEVIRTEHQDMVRAFDADPRVIELERLWGQCMASKGYADRDLSSFLRFVESYNGDAAALVNFVGHPDFADQRQRIVDAEADGAVDAVQCAAPHREDYAAVWTEFEARFLAEHPIPALRGSA